VLRFASRTGPARAAGVVAKFTDLAFEGKARRSPATAARPAASFYVEDPPTGSSPALKPEAAGRTTTSPGDEVVTDPRNRRAGTGKHRQREIVHMPPRPRRLPGKALAISARF